MTEFRTWYDSLNKPSWTPEPSTIGTIWAVIYPLIAVAAVATVVKVFRGELPRSVLVPLALNIAANIAFTPIQFGLRNLPLASADILRCAGHHRLVDGARVEAGSAWIVLPLAPYLLWVSTATVLQLTITFANRG